MTQPRKAGRAWAQAHLRLLAVALAALLAGEAPGRAAENAAAGDRLRLELKDGRYFLLVHDFERRQVLELLAEAMAAKLDWRPAKEAENRISGQHSGTLEAIAIRLLADSNYRIEYDMSGPAPRIVRIVVFDMDAAGVDHGSETTTAAASEPAVKVRATGCTAAVAGRKAGGQKPGAGDFAFAVAGRPGRALLDDGRVLIGDGPTGCVANEAGDPELFDPATGETAVTGPMTIRRTGYILHKLAGGDLLAFGGSPAGRLSDATDAVERFDPATGRWTVAGYLTGRRSVLAGCELSGGKVLLMTDADREGLSGAGGAEIFDVNTGTSERLKSAPRFSRNGVVSGAPLLDGRCLIARDGATFEAAVYDPADRTFTEVTPPPGVTPGNTESAALSRLPDGSWLYLGSNPMIFDPQTGAFRMVPGGS